MVFDPEQFARGNIRRLAAYSSARHEFAGEAEIYLDANENAFGSPVETPLSRYPDPMQIAVKEKVAKLKEISPGQIFLGSGSDEAIDLLFRIFCEPRRDEVIICPPTYGMYRVSADINDVAVKEIPLTADFQLDLPRILDGITEQTKIIFVCSPNNPTGNLLNRDDILQIAGVFDGIVAVDEAYVDFSFERSLLNEIAGYPNIVVLQTFSKAWGLAGARVGLAFSSEATIRLFNRVKPPYNISQLSQSAVLAAIENQEVVNDRIGKLIENRRLLSDSLGRLEFVKNVYPSDANFLLVKVVDAGAVYRFLLEKKIVVRDRSNVQLCEGCLRITVGTSGENEVLINALRSFDRNKLVKIK